MAARKLVCAPDVVQTQTLTAIMPGSGDRERPPLQATADRFRTLLGRATEKGAPLASPVTDANPAGLPTSLNVAAGAAGCRLDLGPLGEKAATSSVPSGGYTYFSTHEPTNDAPDRCATNVGTATSCRIARFSGATESVEIAGGGHVPALRPLNPVPGRCPPS